VDSSVFDRLHSQFVRCGDGQAKHHSNVGFDKLELLFRTCSEGPQSALRDGCAWCSNFTTSIFNHGRLPAHALNRSAIGALVASVALNKDLLRGF
jgi:hypothetical protein